jgi:sarcosine oxidase
MDQADVIVIGAGVAGAAAARALAKTGRDVLLFEQFDLGHARGSSHGTSRIFRFSYDDPMYVRMAMEALPLWRELESEIGETLIVTLGGIDCGKHVGKHADAMDQSGARYEVLSPGRVAERFPRLRVPEGPDILFHPDAGIALADKALRAFISSARNAGAEVRERSAVRELAADGRRAIVSTDGATLAANVAIVTVGAWAGPLLEGVGIELPVVPTRETVAYFRMDEELGSPTIVDWRQTGQPGDVGDAALYSLPSPGVGIKAGEHHAGPVTDPNDVGAVSDESVERISRWVAERYPTADPEPLTAETCIYTNTSDERFVLERYGPIVVGSACSGHGFKFGPLTGRRLAELAGEPAHAAS